MIRIDFTPEASGEGVLYRALRPGVEFPLVRIAPHPDGPYEAVREEGEPDGAEGVYVIDRFDVPEADDDGFLAGWDAGRGALARQRGYLGARLHRAAGPADFRFVDVGRWSSPLMVHRARRAPGVSLPADPALYQVSG